MRGKKFQIFVLLLILATVVQQTLQEDADLDWDKNFYVAVYPINADNSAIVSAYINTLSTQDFEPVAEFFAEEAQRYQLGSCADRLRVELGDKISKIPACTLPQLVCYKVIWWSLQVSLYFA